MCVLECCRLARVFEHVSTLCLTWQWHVSSLSIKLIIYFLFANGYCNKEWITAMKSRELTLLFQYGGAFDV